MRSCKSLQLWLAVSFGCRVGDCLSGAMVRSTIRVAEMSVDVFEGSRPPSLEADDGELSSVTWAGSRGLAEYIARKRRAIDNTRQRRVCFRRSSVGLGVGREHNEFGNSVGQKNTMAFVSCPQHAGCELEKEKRAVLLGEKNV